MIALPSKLPKLEILSRQKREKYPKDRNKLVKITERSYLDTFKNNSFLDDSIAALTLVIMKRILYVT